jgi:hypothetical protein
MSKLLRELQAPPHELRLHIERVMYYSPDDMFRLYMDQER